MLTLYRTNRTTTGTVYNILNTHSDLCFAGTGLWRLRDVIIVSQRCCLQINYCAHMFQTEETYQQVYMSVWTTVALSSSGFDTVSRRHSFTVYDGIC